VTFFLFGAYFLYSALSTHERTLHQNLFRLILVVCAFLTMIGLSERKKHPYQNWMPSIVKGFTVTYALFLIVICQQNYSEAKSTWNIIEPAVSEEQAKRFFATWQTNCDFSLKNFSNKLDRYSSAHLFGWIFHAILIRDYWTMHFWSTLTELVELLFGEVIPPLAECWWDQIICDMLVTNLPGMIIGMFIIRKLGWREFDWLGRKDAKSFRDWAIWRNHKKILALFLLLLGYSIQFLGCFFVPNAFHTSPTSNFSGIRLLIWFLIGHSAFKELYDYSCEPIDHETTVGGHFGQIGLTVMLAEITIMVKHYNDSVILFKGSFSLFRKAIVPVSVGVFVLWYIYARTLIPKKPKVKAE
jgi:phosphatidylserine synthase 2